MIVGLTLVAKQNADPLLLVHALNAVLIVFLIITPVCLVKLHHAPMLMVI